MASNDSKITNPWFEHDENASADGKFLKMFRDFRKLVKDMPKEDLEGLAVIGAYGIFWRLVEFLHGNLLAFDEADIIADDLRIEPKYVEMILNDFDLFYQKDGYYFSDRIMRNLEKRKEKSKKNSEAVNIRWLLHSFNESYKEFFNEEPVLTNEEIENLKTYAKKIPDLKEKLRDIVYSLSCVKFDTDVKFKPCANWLLKGNNLARLLNGEFGGLKHKATTKEIKEAEKTRAEEAEKRNVKSELELRCESASGKAEAISIIQDYYKNVKLTCLQHKAMVLPYFRTLMERFDITDKEVIEKCQQN